MRGVAGNCTSGYNFGVLGALQGSQAGAAIFGTTSGKTLGLRVDERYAGYFDGNVKVTGSLQGNVVNSAEVNAKSTQTLRPINSALDGIASANPFMYIVRTQVPGIGTGVVPDSATLTGTVAPTSDPVVSFGKSYYALDVNAVKQSFPALIIKDAQGNEYVNYTQLVPILVQAIKELKTELDDLKEAVASSGTRKVNAATNIATNTLDEGWGSISQNTPNPFTGQSTVRVSVPDDASDAYVDILTLNGASLKRIPVSNGLSEVSLSSFEFAPGTYLYTLVVNGKVSETRRMIVNR
ncbi:MAG: T9SS type A sorting domain-containing protein [Prevotella sp.]|nr:T9SS type A sorting domain-containing protein [Prevotella sp.]